MKIAIASDHAGFDLKQELVRYAAELGHDVVDLGPDTAARVDYPDFAHRVARRLEQKGVDRGILVCGSGIGMCMAANRHLGVRAAVATDVEQARLARFHNDANVLCLGARLTEEADARDIVRSFLESDFEGGRHVERVEKIDRPSEE